MKKPKILVILGPTATGKSELAVKLANRLRQGYGGQRKIKGEVISGDSRQVYIGLDIGTGKITRKEMLGVPHHMIDVVSPKKVFSVAEWKKQTEKVIESIISRNKLPIICGGTGFYIQSIVDNIVLPEVPPNIALRKKLSQVKPTKLFEMLKKLDPERAKTIEKENSVRLIRAIEIAKALGSVPKLKKQRPSYQILQIGLTLPNKELRQRIHARLLARMKKGMVKEAQNLHKGGLSLKRMRELGLEYRYLANLIENKMTKSEFSQKLETEIWHLGRRQMTWFKRDKRVKWFKPKEIRKIKERVKKFLY